MDLFGERRYSEIRREVVALSRRMGRRPTAVEVVSELHLESDDELAVIDDLQRKGMIRRDDESERWRAGGHYGGGTGTTGSGGNRAYRPSGPAGTDSDIAASILAAIGGGLKRLLKREDLSDPEVVAAYREGFARRIDRERSGLAGHTTAYLGVNGMLVTIWLITGAGFPWFLIPAMGWGIGYVSHRASVSAREREYQEIIAAEHLDRRRLELHRQLWKIRRGWFGHLASNVMTIVLLGTINLVTGGIPWAIIPSTFIAVGLVTHRSRFRSREATLLSALEAEGFRVPSSGTGVLGSGFGLRVGSRTSRRGLRDRRNGSANDAVATARSLAAEITNVVKKSPEAQRALGSDYSAALERYVGQIESLDRTYREITELFESIPIDDLRRDRKSTAERLLAAGEGHNERLRAEYTRAVEQIDRQIRSFEELEAEREILRLQIATAIQALQQVKIDVTRTQSTHITAGDGLDELRTRSREISRYLEDLRSAWSEIS
ncbi:MAG: 2TM domain-containing protein [Alkalispirochaeta sp.]